MKWHCVNFKEKRMAGGKYTIFCSLREGVVLVCQIIFKKGYQVGIAQISLQSLKMDSFKVPILHIEGSKGFYLQ